MFILRKLAAMVTSESAPEENLLSTVAQGDGFFITSPGAVLKAGRYKVIRKLGRGRFSNTFLVEDLQPRSSSLKYLAAKILTVDFTNALQIGLIHEPDFLQTIAERSAGTPEPLLPVLRDHFAQRGPHGVHYCILTSPLRSDVHAFRASAPTGKLAVHIVKPIIACVVEALKVIHVLDIIHADIKADNVLFLGPNTAEIEETIAREPPLVDGTFEFKGTQYHILRSQPFRPKISWSASPFVSETIQVVLSDLGAGLWADKPKPPGDIGAFALRAPENVIRAECGKEIDIWAVGCMVR
jgi:serine/threonine-protein kinase SRPK3